MISPIASPGFPIICNHDQMGNYNFLYHIPGALDINMYILTTVFCLTVECCHHGRIGSW